MKTKIIGLLVSLFAFMGFAFAGDLAGFVVNVNPSTLKVGEPADLTIKAVDSDGNVVTDYNGDIIITVVDNNGNELDITDYVAPNDGTYEFTDEDQGVKTFTKGLIINKSGDFKVRVEDFDSGKYGTAPVKVVSADAATTTGNVKIISPVENETITSTSLSVAGQAPNYKNSKFQVFIDGKVATEGLVDAQGSIQSEVPNLSNGKHTLQIKVLDLNSKVVAESKKLDFNVKASAKLFQKITFSPSAEVNQGTKVTVNVQVDPSVTSAVLHIASYGDYPMDRISTTEFSTEFVANTPGKFDVSLSLTTNNGKKDYNNIKKLVVLQKIAVGTVTFERDNHQNTIALNWKFTGQVPAFKVEYGTEQGKYTNNKIVKTNKFTIENIDSTKTYFVKIFPVDSDGNVIGDPSKEIVIEPNLQKAATCKIDNIKVNVIKKGGNNYLVWEKVPGAKNYLIYQGGTKDNLQKIATTTGTSYQLPFDPTAKKVKYAYFAVKASCSDGTVKQIDKVKKVTVGPMDWLLYALIITMIIYGLKLSYRD